MDCGRQPPGAGEAKRSQASGGARDWNAARRVPATRSMTLARTRPMRSNSNGAAGCDASGTKDVDSRRPWKSRPGRGLHRPPVSGACLGSGYASTPAGRCQPSMARAPLQARTRNLKCRGHGDARTTVQAAAPMRRARGKRRIVGAGRFATTMTSLASNVSPFAHHRGRHYAGARKALSRMTGQVVIAEAEPRTRHFVMTYVLRYNITYVGSTPTMEPALRDRPPTVRWTVKEPRPSRRKSNGRSHVLLSAMAAVLVAGLMILPACAQDGAVRLKVVATFSILGDFAKKIGGDRADVATLVGPKRRCSRLHADRRGCTVGQECATSHRQWSRAGGMAAAADRSLSGSKASIVTASDGIVPRKVDAGNRHRTPGSADPHAWQSVANAEVYVANIRDAMIAADPADADVYKASASHLIWRSSKRSTMTLGRR